MQSKDTLNFQTIITENASNHNPCFFFSLLTLSGLQWVVSCTCPFLTLMSRCPSLPEHLKLRSSMAYATLISPVLSDKRKNASFGRRFRDGFDRAPCDQRCSITPRFSAWTFDRAALASNLWSSKGCRYSLHRWAISQSEGILSIWVRA